MNTAAAEPASAPEILDKAYRQLRAGNDPSVYALHPHRGGLQAQEASMRRRISSSFDVVLRKPSPDLTFKSEKSKAREDGPGS